MNTPVVRFSREINGDFIKDLKKRVKLYFESKEITPYGNARMVWKTVFMVSLYFIPYIVMLTGVVTNFWASLGLWLIMGIGTAGIGLSVMHDANHGSYSRNQKVNKWVSYVINLVGGSAPNWQIQHNVLHHSFTNIHGMDEDIDPPSKLLRFSPHQKRYKIHRFQHIYAWFFYGLMTLFWALSKDFKQLNRYKKSGLIKKTRKSYGELLTRMLFSKAAYYTYIIVLPLWLSGIVWWQVVIGFLLMHFVAGLILSAIFQPAHVMPTSEYPLPDEKGNVENNWAIHQMLTTTNFAPKSRLFSWFVGGLNYQIEHHLFPNICHIHYRDLSKIVRDTAKEYKVPYNVQMSFFKALFMHTKMLKTLGTSDTL